MGDLLGHFSGTSGGFSIGFDELGLDDWLDYVGFVFCDP